MFTSDQNSMSSPKSHQVKYLKDYRPPCFLIPQIDLCFEILDENRLLRAQAGSFQDDFDPLAVHLYRLR